MIPPGTAFTVNVDTGAMTALPGSMATQGNDFAIAPLGGRIAYTNCCGAPLHVANLDGTNDQVITPVGNAGMTPAWSPDGSMVVYQQRTTDASSPEFGDLFIYNVLDGTTHRITNFGQTPSWGWYALFPSFANDGARVLYQQPRGGPKDPVWDIWSVPVSGGQPRLERQNAGWGAGSGYARAWVSPVSPRTFAGSVLRTNQTRHDNGKGLVQGKDLSWLRYSPDGSKLAYLQGNFVYVVNVGSGVATRIASGNSPEWVGDHTLVMGAPG